LYCCLLMCLVYLFVYTALCFVSWLPLTQKSLRNSGTILELETTRKIEMLVKHLPCMCGSSECERFS
jgi:hypothetical protein